MNTFESICLIRLDSQAFGEPGWSGAFVLAVLLALLLCVAALRSNVRISVRTGSLVCTMPLMSTVQPLRVSAAMPPLRFAVTNATCCAGLAMLIATAMLSIGITLGPDGWAYWEGSVSIIRGSGYSYFGGQTIVAFPPLFSMALSLAQSAFGVSGAT